MRTKAQAALPELLTELREKQGLTQLEVATHLGYATAQFISNWERGLSSPPLKSLRELAKLYKVNAEFLFGLIFEETMKETEQRMRKEWERMKKHGG